jgi:hypothetical protein
MERRQAGVGTSAIAMTREVVNGLELLRLRGCRYQ